MAVQPGRVMAHAMAAGVEAAMVGVGSLIGGDGLLLGAVEVQGNLLGEAAGVVLERQRIVGPPPARGWPRRSSSGFPWRRW